MANEIKKELIQKKLDLVIQKLMHVKKCLDFRQLSHYNQRVAISKIDKNNGWH